MAALQPAVATPLLVVGESLVDVVVRPATEATPERHVGGSPANVAIGLKADPRFRIHLPSREISLAIMSGLLDTIAVDREGNREPRPPP